MSPQRRIPIRNIYHMISYAWDIPKFRNEAHVGDEDFNQVENLLGHLLSLGVSKLLKRGFHREYVEQNEDLVVIRGRIDFNETFKRQLLNNKIFCNHDEYCENVIFNQILKHSEPG